MLDRLVGLETEYAIRCHASHEGMERTSNSDLFRRILREVEAEIPTASQLSPLEGRFIVNGGRIHFESGELAFGDPMRGLVEAATPECRGPRQLLLYQRAQDLLLTQATQRCSKPNEAISLIKNNRDSQDNHYGSHENYEATFASGWALRIWRWGLTLAAPLVPIGLIASAVLAVVLPPLVWVLIPDWARLAFFVLIVATCLAYKVVSAAKQEQLREKGLKLLRHLLSWYVILSLLPLLIVLGVLVRILAFRRIRRELTAFLISRPIFAGSGSLSDDGTTFSLSARAGACRCLCSVASEIGRPIFYFGHVMKAMLALCFAKDLERFRSLFRPRQRFQICLGDSNMAQTAEYLRIGTTLLVLDAIEAGALHDAPRVWRPLRALRTICADPTLQARVRLSGSRRWTALQIQRFYLQACERYLRSSDAATDEAWELLSLWRDTLDTLEEEPELLVGKVDWITKRYLIEQAGSDASPASRRKIDLRYHELSDEGYFSILETNGIAPELVTDEEVRRAIHMPPSRSPAATRSRYIREFSGGAVSLTVGWESLVLGPDKVISMADYHDRPTDESREDSAS